MVVVDGVEMLDVREAASLAHRTPETIRRWVWSGRLTARRHGNRLLLAKEQVEKLAGDRGDHSAERRSARMTLAEWVTLAQRTRGHGAPGVSARDLVLEERRSRGDGGDASAGR